MPRAFSGVEQERIRARLLAAGRDALPRTGFRRTAVEELTRAAGISKGAFYKFFDSKEELWLTLLREGEAEARSAVLAAVAEPGPERVRRMLDALVAALADSPTLRTLTDAEDTAWLSRSLQPGVWDEARADDDRFFAALWSRLRDAGELRDDVSADVFAGLPPTVLALAQQRALLGPDRADSVIQLVIEGLALRLSRTGSEPSPKDQRTG